VDCWTWQSRDKIISSIIITDENNHGTKIFMVVLVTVRLLRLPRLVFFNWLPHNNCVVFVSLKNVFFWGNWLKNTNRANRANRAY
jgi:hypothetical protein